MRCLLSCASFCLVFACMLGAPQSASAAEFIQGEWSGLILSGKGDDKEYTAVDVTIRSRAGKWSGKLVIPAEFNPHHKRTKTFPLVKVVRQGDMWGVAFEGKRTGKRLIAGFKLQKDGSIGGLLSGLLPGDKRSVILVSPFKPLSAKDAKMAGRYVGTDLVKSSTLKTTYGIELNLKVVRRRLLATLTVDVPKGNELKTQKYEDMGVVLKGAKLTFDLPGIKESRIKYELTYDAKAGTLLGTSGAGLQPVPAIESILIRNNAGRVSLKRGKGARPRSEQVIDLSLPGR